MLRIPDPPPLPVGSSLVFPISYAESSRCSETACPESEITSQVEASKLCKHLFTNQSSTPGDCSYISIYSKVMPVLQEGPSCGLAALCMAGQLIQDAQYSPQFKALEDVIEIAQKRGYTCRGEMFSANDMRDLTEELLTCNVELITNGFEQRGKIIRHLLKGLAILVPYDADANHEPCCRQGHKAHWAVLLGLVFVTSKSAASLSHILTVDPSLPWLYHINTGDNVKSEHSQQEELVDLATSATMMYVYANQGKSRHTGLWNIEALASSNANLYELCPKRRDSIHKYIVPKDGIQSGLCRQMLLLG